MCDMMSLSCSKFRHMATCVSLDVVRELKKLRGYTMLPVTSYPGLPCGQEVGEAEETVDHRAYNIIRLH